MILPLTEYELTVCYNKTANRFYVNLDDQFEEWGSNLLYELPEQAIEIGLALFDVGVDARNLNNYKKTLLSVMEMDRGEEQEQRCVDGSYFNMWTSPKYEREQRMLLQELVDEGKIERFGKGMIRLCGTPQEPQPSYLRTLMGDTHAATSRYTPSVSITALITIITISVWLK